MSKQNSEEVLAKIIARPVYGQGDVPEKEKKWVGEIYIGEKQIFEGNPGSKDDAFRQCSYFVFSWESRTRTEFFRGNK